MTSRSCRRASGAVRDARHADSRSSRKRPLRRGGDVLGRHRAQPSRGQLDGEWQAVETNADLRRQPPLVSGGTEPGVRGPAALPEEPLCRAVLHTGRVKRARALHRPRRAAHGWWPAPPAADSRAAAATPLQRRRCGRARSCRATGGPAGRRWPSPRSAVATAPLDRRQPHGGQHLVRNGSGSWRGAAYQPHPAGEPPRELGGRPQRQPGLAHATGAGQGDHAVLVEEVHHGGGLLLPAHEARHRSRQVGR